MNAGQCKWGGWGWVVGSVDLRFDGLGGDGLYRGVIVFVPSFALFAHMRRRPQQQRSRQTAQKCQEQNRHPLHIAVPSGVSMKGFVGETNISIGFNSIIGWIDMTIASHAAKSMRDNRCVLQFHTSQHLARSLRICDSVLLRAMQSVECRKEIAPTRCFIAVMQARCR